MYLVLLGSFFVLKLKSSANAPGSLKFSSCITYVKFKQFYQFCFTYKVIKSIQELPNHKETYKYNFNKISNLRGQNFVFDGYTCALSGPEKINTNFLAKTDGTGHSIK